MCIYIDIIEVLGAFQGEVKIFFPGFAIFLQVFALKPPVFPGFPGFPGMDLFFQVFQVRWEPCLIYRPQKTLPKFCHRSCDPR